MLWLALSGLFAIYTAFAGSYDQTYGSLAGQSCSCSGSNYSAFALLFGAELNAELDHQADIHAAGGRARAWSGRRDANGDGERARGPLAYTGSRTR